MEQVESSWTGERPSPAPGENMAAPFLLAKEASRRCSLGLVSSFMVSPPMKSDKLFFDSIRYQYDMRVFFSIRYDIRASKRPSF